MANVNIALTLPGEGSLGAFEAGAVAALLVALQAIAEDGSDDVTLDAITGASSGALTAVLGAGALVTGRDPVTPLRRAWVVEPSLPSLWGHRGAAPLSLDRAREVGRFLLKGMLEPDGDPEPAGQRAQGSAVTLEFALTCLRGFTYEIPRPNSPTPGPTGRVAATSYLDWSRHRFVAAELRGLTDEWLAALDAAIASASDPLVFPPTLLDRSSELEQYRRNGVTNLPWTGDPDEDPALDELQYADGGLVDREPVARCLRLIRGLDREREDRRRVVVVVRPRADHAPDSDDPDWTGAGEPLRWRTTLARGYRIMTTHSLYEDLRRTEKTNNRIAWADQLVDGLAPLIETDARARAVLGGLVKRIRQERKAWRGNDQSPVDGTVREMLAFAVGAAAGVENKRQIDIEVVAAPDTARLAGSARGFLAERLRANDFVVGYRQMLGWMEDRLSTYLGGGALQTGLREARRRAMEIPGWTGGTSVNRRTAVRGSAALLRAGLRAGRAGLREIPVARKPRR